MKLKINAKCNLLSCIKLGACCLFLFTFIANSQAQGTFKFHVGPAFATGDFGDDDASDEDSGGAGVGINVGVDYLYPLSESGLSFFGGLDVSYNGLKGEYRDDIEDNFQGVDIKFFNYINVPVSAGLLYEVAAADNFSLFANAGLAFNFLKVTNLKLEQGNEEVELSYGLSNKLGFKFGAGVVLNEKTTIAVNVFNIGEHDLDVEREATGQQDQNIDGEQKITFVTLTVGFLIN